MKKLLSSICGLAMVLSLVACSASEPSTSPDPEAQSKVESNNTSASTPDETVATEAALELAAFQEIVAVDNEYCTIKITGIDANNLWGYTLKAYLENKTPDKTFMFSVDSASVNGVMADPLFASEVAAGKKSNGEISFTTDTLTANGVGDFTDLELSFRVYDNEDWTADPVATPVVHVYPYGEEHAAAFVREQQPTDVVLADNEYATVILTGCEEDDIWGYHANLFIVNKADTSIMVSVDEASINGFMVDPLYADTVNAGKCAFSTITWFDTQLEENGITAVETIEFTLRIYDNEDWTADDFYHEIVTITP